MNYLSTVCANKLRLMCCLAMMGLSGCATQIKTDAASQRATPLQGEQLNPVGSDDYMRVKESDVILQLKSSHQPQPGAYSDSDISNLEP